MSVQTAWAYILAGAGAIVALAKAWEIVRRWLHPESEVVKIVERQQDMLSHDKRALERHDQEIDDLRRGVQVLCRTQYAQINHELSGNDIEHLREARDELQSFLTSR